MSEYEPGPVPPIAPGFDPNDPSLFVLPPSWPRVIGILSIVWASLGLLCGGCGLAFLPFQASMAEPMLDGAPLPPAMVLGPLDWTIAAIGLALTGLLFAAGIATVMRKPIGRGLHLAYAVASVPVVAVNIWNTLEKQAAMAQWVQDYPNTPLSQSQAGPAAAVGEAIGIIIVAVFGLAWPVFCLIWFGLVKRTAESMTGGVTEDVL